MITQEIINKLKTNEAPYGILKTKDWFTDEVDKFMKDNTRNLEVYKFSIDCGWRNKTLNGFETNGLYRLKQDYVLPAVKEVYVLYDLLFDSMNMPYYMDNAKIRRYDTITNKRFLGFYFGTKEEFEEYYKEHIKKVDKHYSVIYQKQGKIINGKLDLKVAKYVIMKGKDYETN